jgi:chromate reductase, NAD(P)H dehydrogenase (quinone)
MAYKIAILVGSLREASINRKVARSICAMRSDNLDCEMVEIGDLPLYNQEYDGIRRRNMSASATEIREPTACCSSRPSIIASIPGVLKNAIDIGSRPYGKSVFDKKPAAIITASPGAIGGFGANHQIRQAASSSTCR